MLKAGGGSQSKDLWSCRTTQCSRRSFHPSIRRQPQRHGPRPRCKLKDNQSSYWLITPRHTAVSQCREKVMTVCWFCVSVVTESPFPLFWEDLADSDFYWHAVFFKDAWVQYWYVNNVAARCVFKKSDPQASGIMGCDDFIPKHKKAMRYRWAQLSLAWALTAVQETVYILLWGMLEHFGKYVDGLRCWSRVKEKPIVKSKTKTASKTTLCLWLQN